MSDASGTASGDVLAQLSALREDGVRAQADISRRVAELRAKYDDPFPAAEVTATVRADERGFPTAVDLTLDDAAAEPAAVRLALFQAFLAARIEHPSLPVAAVGELVDIVGAAAPGRDVLAERGVPVTNDLGQVTVTGLLGDIVAIDAQDAWLTRTPADAIADEVLRTAQRAALASDTHGRFSEEATDA